MKVIMNKRVRKGRFGMRIYVDADLNFLIRAAAQQRNLTYSKFLLEIIQDYLGKTTMLRK